MATNDAQPDWRVVYVGTGRRPRLRILNVGLGYEDERTWRQRLATEMEDSAVSCRIRVSIQPTSYLSRAQGS